MAYIILSVTGLLGVLLIRSTWSRTKQVVFFCKVIASGMIASVFANFISEPNVISKGPSVILSQIPWLEIMLYLIMIAGMAAKYLYDAIGKGNNPSIEKWQFFRPLLVSPIVFGSIYANLGNSTPSLLLFIFSFQNGFFWQTVLKRK